MSETTATAPAKPQVPTFGRDQLAPGAYGLDLSVVSAATVTVNGKPSTFVEAYAKLRDSKIQEMPESLWERYVTSEGEIELGCDSGVASTMRMLVELSRQGIEPYSLTWFYYGHDWSRDADESYSFFAVHGDKLVMESCHLHSHDPLILKRREVDNDPIWHSHPSFDEAWERYWYRKFYSETMTGQLMVLRPDEPILYHYERPQDRDDVQFITLVKIYRLLLVAIPLLAAIAFPSIREYLEMAAAVFGGVYLWLCWKTRKVGRT